MEMFGKAAFVKCEQLEEEFAAGREARLERVYRFEWTGPNRATNPLRVTGRGMLECGVRVSGSGQVRAALDGKEFVLGAAAGVFWDAFPLRAAGMTLQILVDGSADQIALSLRGAGLRFEEEGGLCADGGTLYVQQGGRVCGWAPGKTLTVDVPCRGRFGAGGGKVYRLAAEGLYRAAGAGGAETLFVPNARHFAVAGGAVYAQVGGKVFRAAAAGALTAVTGAAADKLRAAGETLLLERGGASWQLRPDGSVFRAVRGTGACRRENEWFYAREGVLYRLDGNGETAVGLGEEAVLCGTTVYARRGGTVFAL